MKILLFVAKIVGRTGGTEKVMCNMANELTLRGHQVTVVCDESKQGVPFYPLMKEVKLINLDGSGRAKQYRIKKIIRELTKPLRRTFLYPFFPNPVERQEIQEFAPRFRNVVHNVKPDIVISPLLTYHVRIVKTIGHDRPLILMHHFDSVDFLKKPFDEFVSLRHCDCLQLLFQSFEKEVQKAFPYQKTCVIPNVVAPIDEVDLANPGESRDEHVITMVGRLDKRQKQQHFLIRSFSYLAKEYPQWKVLFYGDTFTRDYEEYLKTLIRKLKLENQMFLMGTTNKLPDVLRKSDIFAFPTAYEGFPLALTEAMAVGLPCAGLKTASAVNELIVDGYNGFLSDNNEQDFAQKSKRLMDDPQLRVTLGRNGHEFVKQFEPKKIWDQWENLITETVKQFSQKDTNQ